MASVQELSGIDSEGAFSMLKFSNTVCYNRLDAAVL